MEHKPLPVLAWIVTALAVLAGGWMAFDGARALIVGDYVTPQEGEYAGELGPWAALLESVGLEPRSTGVKVFFLVYGLGWLGAVAALITLRAPWTWWAALVMAVGALWYLPFGTLLGAVQAVLLNLPSVRHTMLD